MPDHNAIWDGFTSLPYHSRFVEPAPIVAPHVVELGVQVRLRCEPSRWIGKADVFPAFCGRSTPFASRKSVQEPPFYRGKCKFSDAVNCTWRKHWVVRQARRSDVPMNALNGDVVAERHVALNWLTGFHNEPGTAWDDIDTPT